MKIHLYKYYLYDKITPFNDQKQTIIQEILLITHKNNISIKFHNIIFY